MQYSLDKISTVQICDDLLTRAHEKKETLERKKRNLGASIDTFRKRMEHINEQSTIVRLSLQALSPAYHAMPEGNDKASINITIKRLELRQAKLEKQARTYNVANLLVRELRYNRLDSQVLAMEEYIDAVERIKTVLNQAVIPASQAIEPPHPPVTQPGKRSYQRPVGTKARRFGRKWTSLHATDDDHVVLHPTTNNGQTDTSESRFQEQPAVRTL
jgi:hypothetical protein